MSEETVDNDKSLPGYSQNSWNPPQTIIRIIYADISMVIYQNEQTTSITILVIFLLTYQIQSWALKI